ncbi:uncharacterized protein [Polyergus mexicanus]|uniref:uncharacterized protein n=1 Tax=Polyergus mexicanus TaxID=615972 RepID=UPI0038B43670
MYAEIYRHTKELGELGVSLIPWVRAVRLQARRCMLERWLEDLSNPRDTSGRHVVEAIRPRLIKWVEKAGGEVSYRMAQVLTGHGCFGSYLCRIGREADARCYHCGGDEDTAQHTLEICPAWADERSVLVQSLGDIDLSLSSVIATMLESGGSWGAVSSFCETVMRQKEEAERERERLPGGRRTLHTSKCVLRNPQCRANLVLISALHSLSAIFVLFSTPHLKVRPA